MALNQTDDLINRALDNLLSDDDDEFFKALLSDDTKVAGTWDGLQQVDAMLKREAQTEIPLPIDFTVSVMERVHDHEARRRWYPLVVGVLTLLSVIAALNIAFPVTIFALDLYQPLLDSPIMTAIQYLASELIEFVQIGRFMLADWFNYVLTTPEALATVVLALVVASIWIGLLEVKKLTAGALQTA
ncbi:MAG: hypothetical protein GYB68_17100 [Chloroflexi bacterium]|nr:hypothetical protein [Chloroflexota bacterium]